MAEQPTHALDQLLELVVLLDDDMTQSLAREGLTVPRAHLAWLVHHNGPTTQRELADALKVTPAQRHRPRRRPGSPAAS